MKNNPVEQDITYYKKVQECFPNLIELDGELIPDNRDQFFKDKMQQVKSQQLKRKLYNSETTDIAKSETYKRFVKMGLITKE